MANSDDVVVRQSLKISLTDRYESNKIGGAYDAKKSGTSTYHDDEPVSKKSQIFDDNAEFVIKQSSGISNFKGANASAYNELSEYGKKVGTSTYAPDSSYISFNAQRFENNPNFFIKQPLKVTNFKGIDDNKSARYTSPSSLTTGFVNKKYKD